MRYQGRNLRKGRLSEPGRIYLLTTVTHKRAPLFAHWENACVVAREIHAMQDPARLETLAWVLMPDHLHWLFALGSRDLSTCMRRFKSRSAHAINLSMARQGAVWQAGFFDHRLRGDEDLHMQAAYILANPLRAGLVERISDYPYWGCRWVSACGCEVK